MTVRSDFLARVAAVGGLGDELVGALHPAAAHPDKDPRGDCRPGADKGVSFESQSLSTPGGVHRQDRRRTVAWQFAPDRALGSAQRRSITKAALDAIGGVSGALARHADRIMPALPADQRKKRGASRWR